MNNEALLTFFKLALMETFDQESVDVSEITIISENKFIWTTSEGPMMGEMIGAYLLTRTGNLVLVGSNF